MKSVVSAKRRELFTGTSTVWDCVLSCGHTQSAKAKRVNSHTWKPAPVRLKCRQCAAAIKYKG